MTKKMGLIALGLGMVLFSGCSSDNITDVDTGNGDTNLNIPSEVKNNIVGSWSSECINFDYGESALSTKIFNADGTGLHTGAEFDTHGCNLNDQMILGMVILHILWERLH